MKLLKGNLPKGVIFGFDLGISLVSIVLAYLLRFNFSIPETDRIYFPYVVAYVVLARALAFGIGRTFEGIITYTSFKDAQRIAVCVSITTVVFFLTNFFTFRNQQRFYIPTSIIIIDFITSVSALVSFRVLIKVMYLEFTGGKRVKSKVLIYGTGNTALTSKRTLERDAGTKYKVIGFIDHNDQRIGKKIEGVRIYPPSDLDDLLMEHRVSHLIIAVDKIPTRLKQEIAEKCLAVNTRVLNVPPIQSWINGDLSFKQIKKIRIEELLEREPIVLDNDAIAKQIKGKVVLVTGAAGSIGTEIVRQVLKFMPSRLVLLDQAESPLFDIEMELKGLQNSECIEVVMGDIRHKERMTKLFQAFQPQVVYHAAAYKHVPMMEHNPAEAIYTNVHGTRILADLSHEFRVETFVMISTDKAVNPTNVMGASKRAAERYVQALSTISKTHFITTRFGNVLGSNGSVIPIFRKQIELGGPVTITHAEITRFFMTIPEACQLVLEAGAMGKGGEIFVFDMGQPVKIADLAKKMIRLSGLTVNRDIQIVYTGLRPGEKLYEELLADGENTLATHHKQIMRAKLAETDWIFVSEQVDHLCNLINEQTNLDLVRELKRLVPEFISNNSEYEQLDANSQKLS